jgi:hypothetical protein
MSTELRWFDIVVALMPTLLYGTLGALGLAIGSAGAAVNLAIASSTIPRAARMVLAVAVTLTAILLWSLLVVKLP